MLVLAAVRPKGMMLLAIGDKAAQLQGCSPPSTDSRPLLQTRCPSHSAGSSV